MMKRFTIALAALLLSSVVHAQMLMTGVGPGSGGNGGIHRNALFGVNVEGAEFAPNFGQTFPSTADWTYLASKGVGFVRLPIAWESLQPTLSTTLNATYLGNITTAIAGAHAHGINVIVDLHNSGGYATPAVWNSTVIFAGNGGVPAAGVNFLGDGTLTSAQFVDLWTRLATALAGTPGLVGYGIMNEPRNITGVNLLPTPNYYVGLGSLWSSNNGSVVTILAAGTNPLGATFGPAWDVTTGTGFGALTFTFNFTATPYTISCYAKMATGTGSFFLALPGSVGSAFTTTTSWQRFSRTATPTAGANDIQIGLLGDGAGKDVQVANCQLELGSSVSAYQPSPYTPFGQAVVTAIRAIDVMTPIYVNGVGFSQASFWVANNFEMSSMTGGNLVFEGHQYFDGPQGVGGGGTYAGTFTSYSINTSSGAQTITSFLAWATQQSVAGYLGEFGVPNSVADNNAQWLPLQVNFLNALSAASTKGTMWFYGSNGSSSGNILNVAPVGGVDDPRLTQMLAVH